MENKFDNYNGKGICPNTIVDANKYKVSEKTLSKNSPLCSTLCIILKSGAYYAGADCFSNGFFGIGKVDEFRIFSYSKGWETPELAHKELMNNFIHGLYP